MWSPRQALSWAVSFYHHEHAVSIMILPDFQTMNLRHRERRARDIWRGAGKASHRGPSASLHYSCTSTARQAGGMPPLCPKPRFHVSIKPSRSWFLKVWSRATVFPHLLCLLSSFLKEEGATRGIQPRATFSSYAPLSHLYAWLWCAVCI